MSEVSKPVVETTKDDRKAGQDKSADWQMDVAEFNHNGCLTNGNGE